eukprot:Nk52_evm2s2124 gene=Nk52_evmTU2s2124
MFGNVSTIVINKPKSVFLVTDDDLNRMRKVSSAKHGLAAEYVDTKGYGVVITITGCGFTGLALCATNTGNTDNPSSLHFENIIRLTGKSDILSTNRASTKLSGVLDVCDRHFYKLDTLKPMLAADAHLLITLALNAGFFLSQQIQEANKCW